MFMVQLGRVLAAGGLCFVLFGGVSWAGYADNGDGTATDVSTGLVWEKSGSSEQMSWTEALAWCEGRTFAGKTDWRLPNKLELESLVDDAYSGPAIDPLFQSENAMYWTSTTSLYYYPSDAWFVNFGGSYSTYAGKHTRFYVRCVREGDVSEGVVGLASGESVTGVSGASGSVRYYAVDVPEGASYLTVSTTGGTGDVALYLKKDGLPGLDDCELQSANGGSRQVLMATNPDQGRYYIQLQGLQAYSGVEIVAEYASLNPVNLAVGESRTLSVDFLGDKYIVLDVQEEVPSVVVRLHDTDSLTFLLGRYGEYPIADIDYISDIDSSSTYTDLVVPSPVIGKYYIDVFSLLGFADKRISVFAKQTNVTLPPLGLLLN